jgi:hypothetical protein
MASEDTYYLLQVWSETKQREFWDCAVFKRSPDEKKGVAHYVESTPRLSWMKNKLFVDIWGYLVEQRRLGKFEFSMTEENKSLKDDLFPKRAHAQSSVPLRSRRDHSR